MLRSTKENSITEVTRRDIVDHLLLASEPFYGRHDIMEFLKRIWDLSAMPSTDSRFTNLEGDLWQHTVNFPDYSDSAVLYERLDILHCPDEVFGKFLATMVHPIIRTPESSTELVRLFNESLRGDGFELRAAASISGRPIYELQGMHETAGSQYEIVLSFAGEQRVYVEAVARILVTNGVRVFCDKYEQATLWGKDLAEHLEVVYRGAARYCIIFISSEYANKLWTTHERRSALVRALAERVEYILPVRFDDTELPGIRPTVGYADARLMSPEEIAALTLQKLGRSY